MDKSKFELVRGERDFVFELASAVKTVLKSLPDDAVSKADHSVVIEKCSEVRLWTMRELIDYLNGDDLFRDTEMASLTWAVVEIAKEKLEALS